jgi:hypothetical protein
MWIAKDTNRPTLADEALACATASLLNADWADKDTWRENGPHCRLLLAYEASLTSEQAVHDRLDLALRTNPVLLRDLLAGCADWLEQHDSQTMEWIGVSQRYSDLPPWFPATTVALQIKQQYPGVLPADEWQSGRYPDELTRLAAQVLNLV